MSNDHMLELPKAVWIIKIIQSVIAVLVLAFSAFTISVIPNGYSGFCIFAAIFSGVTLVYYFVSIHANKSIFNWIAVLILECFNVLWWLVVWATLAAFLGAAAYVYSNYYDDYYYKRDLVTRATVGEWNAAGIMVYVTLAVGLINWILFIVTLVLISRAVHRHRKAGRPMQYGGTSTSGFNNASKEEKHDMQPMPTGQTYPPNGQGQAPMHYEHQPQTAPGYPPQQGTYPPQQGGYPASPVPNNTHEVYGGNPRY